MRPARIIAVVVLAVAIAGCGAHSSADQPSPPPNPGPTSVDRQAPIYAAVLRQYLTSGHGHYGADAGFGGHRFPQIFVLDRAVAGAGATGQGAPGGPIPPVVQHAIARALADVGPATFASSPDAVIMDRGCAQVRDEGILITLGPVGGVGDQVQVGVNGFVACLAANSLTYRVERARGSWRVAGIVALGPVS